MPRTTGLKIVITNQVALNTGDGAILSGLIFILKRAFGDSIALSVVDRHGSVSRRYYPEIEFRQAYPFEPGKSLHRRALSRIATLKPILRLIERLARSKSGDWLLPRSARNNLDEYRSADLVVSTGGTYLVEHYRLEVKFLQLALALSSGTPTVMFTQSLGPFRKPANRRAVAELLPGMALVLLRDRRSLENLTEAGASTNNARVVPDAAFALAKVEQLSARQSRRDGDGLRVAVSVRSWRFPNHPAPDAASRNYRQSIREIVALLVRTHGAQVTFLSTCQGVSEYEYDDSAVALEIVRDLPADVAAAVTVDGDFHHPEALRDMLGEFDFVVATRMHVGILSLCAGTPVLPIAYEFKTRELFEGLGLGEWVLDIDTLQPAESAARADSFVASLDRVCTQMIPRVIEQYEGALAVVPDLVRIVAKGGR